MTRAALVALVAAGLGVLAAGCGGGDDAFQIGFVQPCDETILSVEEQLAGAELPFLRRGAKPLGARPSDGVEGVEIAGRTAELLIGCASGTAQGIIEETRRLVEDVGVDAIVVANFTDPGIKEYVRTQPGVTFLPGGWWGQSFQDPAPNFFTFLLDANQLSAGLGTYAYRDLGWRTAAVIGEDYAYPYGEAAGFIAEFCALGGKVVTRVWMPSGPTDYAPFVARIPKAVDGYFVSVVSGNFSRLVQAWRSLPQQLGGRVLTAGITVGETEYRDLGDRLRGVANVGPLTDPFVAKAIGELTTAFPSSLDPSGQLVYGLVMSGQVEALLRALEAVEGDAGDGQTDLRSALRSLVLDPYTFDARIRLDERGQAIADELFLFRVDQDGEGNLAPHEFRRIDDVDQSYGGLFGPDTPPFSRSSPPCVSGNAPPWAGR